MRAESDEIEDEDMDDINGDDHTAKCPKDGSSLFVDMCEYYCWECEQFYCPVCLTICDPLNLMDRGAHVCSHYAASEFDGVTTDDLGRDNGLLTFDKDGADKRGDDGMPPKSVAEFLFSLGSARERLGEELLSSMTASDLDARFGGLYSFMSEDYYSFGFDYMCRALSIVVKQAYYDDSPCPTYYFCPIGGDRAWDIIRPALQQYVHGLQWLKEQVSVAVEIVEQPIATPESPKRANTKGSVRRPASSTSAKTQPPVQPAPSMQPATRQTAGVWHAIYDRIVRLINSRARRRP